MHAWLTIQFNVQVTKKTNHLSFTTDARSWAFAFTHSLYLSLSHMPLSLSRMQDT